VLGDVIKESVAEFVKKSIDARSFLLTDPKTAYLNLEMMVEEHIKVKSGPGSANGDLNWVHTAISNLKKNLLGIYHMVNEKYLQNYLNEFANSSTDILVINCSIDWLLLQFAHSCNIPKSHI